jgi:hypothetical protein
MIICSDQLYMLTGHLVSKCSMHQQQQCNYTCYSVHRRQSTNATHPVTFAAGAAWR